MAATDVVNASALYNPEFRYREALPTLVGQFQARAGRPYSRALLVRGRTFELEWQNRALAVKAKLQQWHQQFEQGFFTLADNEMGRYYTGRFQTPPLCSPEGYERWNIQATFVELPGLAMFAYPTNWARDAIFIDEVDDFGTDTIRKVGAGWAFGTQAWYRNGATAYITNTNNDYAEWQYIGYGFRLWSPKAGSYGIVAVSVDGGAETNVDLYNAATLNSAAVFTNANLSLGLHRVKIRNTGTKNGASSAFNIVADAIEVMR